MSSPRTEYGISIDEMKKLVEYDKNTGKFYKLSQALPSSKGYKYRKYKYLERISEAGTIDKQGYVKISIQNSGAPYIRGHRLAWAYIHGYFPSEPIDHINGDRKDNRISNLREAPSGLNSKNMKKHNTNMSGHVGVSWCKKAIRWRASIWDKDKQINLGYFKEKNDAIRARKEAEMKYNYHTNHGREI